MVFCMSLQSVLLFAYAITTGSEPKRNVQVRPAEHRAKTFQWLAGVSSRTLCSPLPRWGLNLKAGRGLLPSPARRARRERSIACAQNPRNQIWVCTGNSQYRTFVCLSLLTSGHPPSLLLPLACQLLHASAPPRGRPAGEAARSR